MAKITEYLMHGRSNAKHMDELSADANLPERAIRKEILDARLQGELIISCNAGYFIASDPEEIREYVIKRKAYIKTASQALRPFVNAIR